MPKGTETVKVYRVTRGRHGAETKSLAATFKRCIVWPRSSSETSGETGGRGTITISGWNVFVPPAGRQWEPGVDPQAVLSTDDLEVREESWQIDGVPGPWNKKDGRFVGTTIAVKGWDT